MRSLLLLSLAIAIISLSVYWQVGNHEFINLDDESYVVNNIHVATGLTKENIIWAFTSTYESNWHPITWLSHMVDVQLYGMNPRGHHFTNVVIHIASALLLFFLLFRLTNSLWKSSFVAALFALHPLHVESVAWIAERKDVLSAFFGYLTLLLYAEYARKQNPWLYISSLITFVFGLMAKPMLVTLPAIMLLMDFWPINRYRPCKELMGQQQRQANSSTLRVICREKVPFFACSLLSAAATIYAQQRGGSLQGIDRLPIGLRIENATTAYIKYIAKMLYPTDLAVYYPFPSSIPFWQSSCSLLILLVISAAVVRIGMRHPYLLTGWFWFLITLLPVIGLIQVGAQSMADRYTYIPLTGLFIIAAWGIPALVKNIPYQLGFIIMAASAVLIISASLTWQQLGYWQNNISLYQHTIQVAPGSTLAHNNLGMALLNTGRLDEAIREFRKALTINNDYIEAHINLGIAFSKKELLDAAIIEFQKVLTINPNHTSARNNLGIVFAKKGFFEEAINEFQKALTINPMHTNARNNLDLVIKKKEQFYKARGSLATE